MSVADRPQPPHIWSDQAKSRACSATVSMAYTTVKFADACLRGLRGDVGVIECAFVSSQACFYWFSWLGWEQRVLINCIKQACCVLSQVTELSFFASRVQLGCNGVEEFYPLCPLNEYERDSKQPLLIA